jgi:hypothetical protein
MLTENDRDGFLPLSDPLNTVVTVEGAEGGAEVTTAVVVDASCGMRGRSICSIGFEGTCSNRARNAKSAFSAIR